jgi:predicted O-methyltransferase YrrM
VGVARAQQAALSLGRHLADPAFAREWVLAGLRLDAEGKAAHLGFRDAYPEAFRLRVKLGDVTFGRWNMDPFEQYVLGALAQIKQPRRIFEIGTFDGSATLTLARNAPGAEIVTLDLPPDHPASGVARGVTESVGGRFHGTPEADQITSLLGDSTTFDFTPWHGTIDLVLVDCDHSYLPARSDTEAALAMLTASGLAIWHDYTPAWPGVVRAVDETRLPVIRIKRTKLAIYDRSR